MSNSNTEQINIAFKPTLLKYQENLPYLRIGKVLAGRGMVYEVGLSKASIGSNVDFITSRGEIAPGEVIGLKEGRCLAMPYKDILGINSDTKVYLRGESGSFKVSSAMLGRVVDFQGNPLDDKGPITGPFLEKSLYSESVTPLKRPVIEEILDTGIKAINAFITLGKGQRFAIMAGSGVGKSVLLGMLAQKTHSDVNVIAMIGERGREVLEFIKNDLGEEGLKKSVIVVATSDMSPLIRLKAAYAATTIAEHFRDEGKDVLLMMDSVTRFATAQREIGLSAGEPPGLKGHTPSVFGKLPKLLERAGTKENAGSITGIYTVLVEGGDMDEPITDAIRAISDGHLILSRELAAKNHYPAIEVLSSISRVMNNIVDTEHKVVASHLRDLAAEYAKNEDLINVGAYVSGSNLKLDKAILVHEQIRELLRQNIEETFNIHQVFDMMIEIARKAENL